MPEFFNGGDDSNGNYEDDSSSKGSGVGTAILFGALFLPSLIAAVLVFQFLRKGRFRPSLITFISFSTIAVFALIWWILDYSQRFSRYFTSWENAGSIIDNWDELLSPVLMVYVTIGIIAGWVYTMFQARSLVKKPELLAYKGSWTHDFKYRKTPLELLRRKKRIQGLKDGIYRGDVESPLGIDETEKDILSQSSDEIVCRLDEEAVTHTLLTGASGSGKTISMLSLIKADIYAGKPVIVLDLKRSPDLASKLAKWSADNAEEHGSEFYHFVNGDAESYDIPHSKGQAFYDPLRTGNTTSKTDMVLGMREYDTASAVYKSGMQRLLSVLFLMLEKVKQLREHTGNTDLCSSLDWDNGGIYLLNSASKTANFIELLNTVINKFPGEQSSSMAKELLTETAKSKSMLSHALGELQGQIQTIVASEYGQWLRTEPGSHSIDLFEASRKRGSVVLFSLNSDDEKEFSRFIGSIIMADITRASASRRNVSTKDLVNIYIDEFQILVPDSVVDLLEKARASAIGITLAQQSLSQVMKGIVGDGEAYLQSILDTCSNFIFHSGAGQETAQRMSDIVGKEWVEVYSVNKRRDNFFFSFNWKNNRQLLVNTSKEERSIVDAQDFMHLSAPSSSNDFKSEAIIIKKSGADKLFESPGGSVAKKVWMIPDQEILEKHYHPTNDETKRIFSENHEDKDDGNLLPLSVLNGGQGHDVAADIEKLNKKKKMGKLKSVQAPEKQKVSEEDLSYSMGLTETERRILDEEEPERTRETHSTDGFSQVSQSSVDIDIDEDWSLEDILEDEEETEKPSAVKSKSSHRQNLSKNSSPRGLADVQRSRKRETNSSPEERKRNNGKGLSGGLPLPPMDS